jgi:hypothetical protein
LHTGLQYLINVESQHRIVLQAAIYHAVKDDHSKDSRSTLRATDTFLRIDVPELQVLIYTEISR